MPKAILQASIEAFGGDNDEETHESFIANDYEYMSAKVGIKYSNY